VIADTHNPSDALVASGKQPIASTQLGLVHMVALTQLQFWVAACYLVSAELGCSFQMLAVTKRCTIRLHSTNNVS
jgi:hypothetical protein